MSASAAERTWSPAPLLAVQETLDLDTGTVDRTSSRLGAPVVPTTSVLRGADAVVVGPALRRHVQQWALAFGQAAVEAVLGDRPVSQLLRWTTPAVHRELAYRARVVSQATLRQAGGHGQRRPAVRPQVRQARICFVDAGVAEVALTIQYGPRTRALASRLELRDGRWLCTVLEFA
ncbi:Rv3235 family protein [Nocardioides jiangxiensis]|uniref:Rv3235 family protein n=1 Tax=Nocardioides jiangxiensis TaxID=3064524 RepID=A0ABT9AZB4_9ACTN|nr:Rv3235 family protein [Nocardioides sp. WY-20]MDO7867465.1 Rv3235 family protein [Nocardioides sp. WY-20]